MSALHSVTHPYQLHYCLYSCITFTSFLHWECDRLHYTYMIGLRSKIYWLVNSDKYRLINYNALHSQYSIAYLRYQFLDTIAKLQKATISFGMSVCLSARNNSAPTGMIFVKLDISEFFGSFPKNSSLMKIWQEYRVLYMKTFMVVSTWIDDSPRAPKSSYATAWKKQA
jgi:hypothetical protein